MQLQNLSQVIHWNSQSKGEQILIATMEPHHALSAYRQLVDDLWSEPGQDSTSPWRTPLAVALLARAIGATYSALWKRLNPEPKYSPGKDSEQALVGDADGTTLLSAILTGLHRADLVDSPHEPTALRGGLLVLEEVRKVQTIPYLIPPPKETS